MNHNLKNRFCQTFTILAARLLLHSKLSQDPNQKFGVPNQQFLAQNNQVFQDGGQRTNPQFPNFGGRTEQNQAGQVVRGETQLKEINGFKIPSQISSSTPGQPGGGHEVVGVLKF